MNIKISLIALGLLLSACSQVDVPCKSCQDMNLYDVDESKKELIKDNIVIE